MTEKETMVEAIRAYRVLVEKQEQLLGAQECAIANKDAIIKKQAQQIAVFSVELPALQAKLDHIKLRADLVVYKG